MQGDTSGSGEGPLEDEGHSVHLLVLVLPGQGAGHQLSQARVGGGVSERSQQAQIGFKMEMEARSPFCLIPG